MPENIADDKDTCELFLDLDLSVLGWPTAEYSDYAQRVRLEYAHIPDQQFLEGRAKVLDHLAPVDRPIFFTKYFQDKYEI